MTARRPLRRAIAVLTVCLLGAACASGAADTATGTSAPNASPSSAMEGTATASASAAADRITIADDLGEVEVPANVERVVTTVDETTELLVALGVQPIGIGSTRVDAAAPADERFATYYLDDEQLGSPEFVGGEALNYEAISALTPDLIVHGADDDSVDTLRQIAPTAVYDVTTPGAWQTALTQLARATGTADRATEIVAKYEADVADAADALGPVVEQAPRLSVIYPNYRGGNENYVFDEAFALAAVVPELGFELVGAETAEAAFPGVFSLSAERYPDLAAATDTIVAVSTEDWRDTGSASVLSAVDVPVVGVPLDDGRPSTGPLSAPAYLANLVSALEREYGVTG